uniref:Uncharacterized protein n=1 Tax=Heterorhabditis bacteriophora TaxID=37862 RepID=A0A1I7XN98_HETBA
MTGYEWTLLVMFVAVVRKRFCKSLTIYR